MTQTLKGFRDFLPSAMRKRLQVMAILRRQFQLAGFEPLETPTLEYAELLLGKYGQEADALVYTFTDRGERHVGLRYDQTVPTARVLGQYAHTLPSFFRRYQIQPVFRADKPQKGRFREFVQCDIDIFGSSSSVADAEILATTYQAFVALGLGSIEIHLNYRPQLLATVTAVIGDSLSPHSVLQSLDKLDKLPKTEVSGELISKGLSSTQVDQLFVAFESATPPEELQVIMDQATSLGVPDQSLKFSPTLARGLDYYTGMIFEVFLKGSGMGALGGGGRYDHLIETLSSRSVPAVGMAFGFDRIVEVLSEQPDEMHTLVLVAALDPESISQQLQVTTSLRQAKIAAIASPEVLKIEKAIKIALQHQATHLVLIGESERQSGKLAVRTMATRTQSHQRLEDLINSLS